jgi:hypothetical protein
MKLAWNRRAISNPEPPSIRASLRAKQAVLSRGKILARYYCMLGRNGLSTKLFGAGLGCGNFAATVRIWFVGDPE